MFSSEIITNIKVGEKYDFKRGSIYFEKINNFEKQNYISIVGTFRIYDDNGKEIYLKPELIKAAILKQKRGTFHLGISLSKTLHKISYIWLEEYL